MTGSPLDSLKAVAPIYGATVTLEQPGGFDAQVVVPLPGGRETAFALAIRDNGLIPQVSELEPRTLPPACIERHINDDGSFCLSWAAGERSDVIDADSAGDYWTRVVRFLVAQRTAAILGSWPGQAHARAHGEAASFQARAEALAATLGESVLRDLQYGKLQVRPDPKRGRDRIELLRRNRRVARTHLSSRSLVTVRTVCICDIAESARTPIEDCGEHAHVLAELTIAMYECQRLHDEHILRAVHNGERCCETMKVCALRQALQPRGTPIETERRQRRRSARGVRSKRK